MSINAAIIVMHWIFVLLIYLNTFGLFYVDGIIEGQIYTSKEIVFICYFIHVSIRTFVQLIICLLHLFYLHL